jgi:hypothetical protein
VRGGDGSIGPAPASFREKSADPPDAPWGPLPPLCSPALSPPAFGQGGGVVGEWGQREPGGDRGGPALVGDWKGEGSLPFPFLSRRHHQNAGKS